MGKKNKKSGCSTKECKLYPKANQIQEYQIKKKNQNPIKHKSVKHTKIKPSWNSERKIKKL